MIGIAQIVNLIIFIYSLHRGGAERVASILANRWAADGWNVTLITVADRTLDSYSLHPAVQRLTLDLARQSKSRFSGVWNNSMRIIELRRLIHRQQPDVVLGVMTTANILLGLSRIGFRGTVFVGSEHTHPPAHRTRRIWKILRSWAYGRLDSVVALTTETAAWLEANTRATQIPVIPNAVLWPLPILKPYVEFPVETGQSVLLAVGRLSEEKGFHHLIEIFARVAGDFPNWKLIIAGEGPERSRLETLCETLTIANQVILPGQVGNIGQWYEAADIFVMTSRVEGFPNTLIEAMAQGVPAVSFDCDTGPRDIIRNGFDGFLVPAGNNSAFEVALRRLMDDKLMREHLSERAKEVRQRFSIENIINQWENLFNDLHGAEITKYK